MSDEQSLRREKATASLHIVWAMVALTAFVVACCTAIVLMRSDGAQIVIGIAAIASPVLIGLLQIMRMNEMHSENKTDLAVNTKATEEIKTIVNGERTSMAAQIEELKEQNQRLRNLAAKVESAVINPPVNKS